MNIQVNDILVNQTTIITDNDSIEICNFYKVCGITPSGHTLWLRPLKKKYIETDSLAVEIVPTEKTCGNIFDVRICSEYEDIIRTKFIINMEQNNITNLCHLFTIYLQKYDSSKKYFQSITAK